MKKIILSTLIATTMGMATSMAFAAPEKASTMLSWSGAVAGGIPSDDLIITGRGGADVVPGTLRVATDGTFTTSTPVFVQAMAYSDGTTQSSLYDGSVDWTVDGGAYVTSTGSAIYDSTALVVKMNNVVVQAGSGVLTTEINEHQINVSVEFPDIAGIEGDMHLNDMITANVIIYAQGTVGDPGPGE